MKIGFIGYDQSISFLHIPFLDIVDEFEVVGYYEVKQVNESNLVWYASIKSLCSEVDVVIITSSLENNYSHTVECLNNKVHVVLDKPYISNMSELYDIANKNNLKLTTYQNRRYDSDFITLKDVLKTYEIGQVYEITSNYTNNIKKEIYNQNAYLNAIKFIDQIVSLYGQPNDVIYDICMQNKLTKINTYFDYYDIKLIYDNMRVRVYFSQSIIKPPDRWIVNASKCCVIQKHIDWQETDLKRGIYPKDKHFGYLSSDLGMNIYYPNEDSEYVLQKYVNYTEFYKNLYLLINNQANSLATIQEALIVQNILQTIVENKKYSKIEV